MKLKQLMATIEAHYPLDLQEDWDNSGLQLGDHMADIQNVLCVLEITHDVITFAIEQAVDCIITHHPLLFKPLIRLDLNDSKGHMIQRLIQAQINVLSYHTSIDNHPKGMNTWLAKHCELTKIETLFPISYSKPKYGIDTDSYGLGMVGIYEGTFETFCTVLRERYPFMKHTKIPKDFKFNHIGIIGGSGAKYMYRLPEHITILVTGDVDYHTAQDAYAMGKVLIDIDHSAEDIFAIEFKKILEKILGEMKCDIHVSAYPHSFYMFEGEKHGKRRDDSIL